MRKKCNPIQHSDEMVCETCGLVWDVNDTCPPECYMTGFTVIERVVKWNSLRYDQKHCKALTSSLLSSEVTDFMGSIIEVDELDSLCDIIYVAMGAMWRMGLSVEQIEEALQIVCDANETKEVMKTVSYRKANVFKGNDFVSPESELFKLLKARK